MIQASLKVPISSKEWLNIDELIDVVSPPRHGCNSKSVSHQSSAPDVGEIGPRAGVRKNMIFHSNTLRLRLFMLLSRYTKPRGLAPDYNAPVVLRKGRSSVEDFCMSIHKEIAKQMK